MIATLRFRLPEERYEFNCAVRAIGLAIGVSRALERLRHEAKHGDHNDDARDALELALAVLREECGQSLDGLDAP